jgi:hypothetical protein
MKRKAMICIHIEYHFLHLGKGKILLVGYGCVPEDESILTVVGSTCLGDVLLLNEVCL